MTTEPLANWNGEEMPLAEVRVSVMDRAFLFGDAIYEVIRVYRGRPFQFDDHLQRLEKNLQKIRISSDSQRLAKRALLTLQHSGIQEGMIYLQVTRGEAPRTHHFPDPPVRPNELIYVRPLSDSYRERREQGGRALLIQDLRWKRCDIKSVNLLANCLGAEEAHAAGYDESLFVNEEGTLVEGTHTSLFAVRQGTLLTAPLGAHLLPGITRRLVLRLAEKCRLPFAEESVHRDRLDQVDEVFVTGTTMELMPIIQIGDQAIGTGTPGPVTRMLQQAYQAEIQAECGQAG